MSNIGDIYFDTKALKTPYYIVDEDLLEKNLMLLDSIKKRTGAKILLAQKAFSMFCEYPLIGKYLDGTTASSYFEARLGYEEMGGETHIFAPAYREDDFAEIVKICDHIVFNSPEQYKKYRPAVAESGRDIKCGIRINPEYSEIETEIYNPCAPNSRMGTKREHLDIKELEGISGLHFHTMCEQGADVLERTLAAVEEKFGDMLYDMEWLNFGGGHHITRADYDVEKLVTCIEKMRDKYDLQIYLEPGEGVVLNTGWLAASVLDTVKNGMDIAILDTSAACHMPDVLEMPYRPPLLGSGLPGEKAYTYRLAGHTCLAGDIIGDYSFDKPLEPGDILVFGDMALYTMVKNNTFNGINLPSIAVYSKEKGVRLIKKFGYEDFKSRLS